MGFGFSPGCACCENQASPCGVCLNGTTPKKLQIQISGVFGGGNLGCCANYNGTFIISQNPNLPCQWLGTFKFPGCSSLQLQVSLNGNPLTHSPAFLALGFYLPDNQNWLIAQQTLTPTLGNSPIDCSQISTFLTATNQDCIGGTQSGFYQITVEITVAP